MTRLVLLLCMVVATPVCAGDSVSHLWLPRRPETAAGSQVFGTAPACVEVIASVGINGTTLAWNVVSAMSAGKHCSVGIFSKDGATQIVSSGAQLCDGIALHTATGLSFTLTAGTAYQVCRCGDHASGAMVVANDNHLQIQTFDNALSVPVSFIGGNPCTGGGDLPATLGTFTFSGSERMLLLVGTNAP